MTITSPIPLAKLFPFFRPAHGFGVYGAIDTANALLVVDK